MYFFSSFHIHFMLRKKQQQQALVIGALFLFFSQNLWTFLLSTSSCIVLPIWACIGRVEEREKWTTRKKSTTIPRIGLKSVKSKNISSAFNTMTGYIKRSLKKIARLNQSIEREFELHEKNWKRKGDRHSECITMDNRNSWMHGHLPYGWTTLGY